MVNKITTPPTTSELIGTVNEIIDNYVTTDTAQEITGQKTIVGQTILKASESASSGRNTVSGFEFQNNEGTFVGRITSTDSNGLAIHSPYDIQLRAHTKANGSITGSNGLTCTSTGVTPASPTSTSPYDLGNRLVPWSNLYLNGTIYAGSNNYAIALPNKAGTFALTSDIPTVDQTYDGTSANAQSGVAVGSAINNIATQLVAAINTKQDTLVSGTNIKTINNQDLLGSGDISITASAVWGSITGTLSSQTDLQNALDSKVNTSSLATVATSGAYSDLSGTPTVDQTYDGTSANAQSGVAVASAVSGKANDADVVHKTGDETISGVKTFNGNNRIVAIQNSTVTYNTTPSSSALTDISFRDKNGYEMGVLEHVRRSDNDTSIHIAVRGADGNWSSNLLVGRRADGTSYTSAPTPSAGDNSNQIATTAWVNTIGNNVVHKTGPETISGTKTFTSPINVPQSDSWFDMIAMEGSNRPYIAGHSNTSITSLALCTLRNGYYYNIELHNNGNGTGYTICPASDANNSIVTTVNKSKAANGYFKLGNGLIVQWGYVNGGTAKTGNVTFPTAFSSVNGVRVVACSNQTSVIISVGGESTTGFTWNKSSSSAYIKWIAVGF